MPINANPSNKTRHRSRWSGRLSREARGRTTGTRGPESRGRQEGRLAFEARVPAKLVFRDCPPQLLWLKRVLCTRCLSLARVARLSSEEVSVMAAVSAVAGVASESTLPKELLAKVGSDLIHLFDSSRVAEDLKKSSTRPGSPR